MPRKKEDPDREERIRDEIVVDAHDSEERALGWHAYLEERLSFPFSAHCVARRSISPLRVKDEVEVTGMADAEECAHEMFVMIRWERDGLAVPLAQLQADGDAEEPTCEAVQDWHYWVSRGYRF